MKNYYYNIVVLFYCLKEANEKENQAINEEGNNGIEKHPACKVVIYY